MIQAGDMAMIVWGCCPAARAFIGIRVAVEAVAVSSGYCTACRCHMTNVSIARVVLSGGERGPFPVAWLRKMPPPEERVDVEETEEVSA